MRKLRRAGTSLLAVSALVASTAADPIAGGSAGAAGSAAAEARQ
jgi:hypothetical protein